MVYKWPLTIEDVVIKWNEMKLKCLKYSSLNIVNFFTRSQIKVDLQLKRFSNVRLRPAFPLLQSHYSNMSRFSVFLRVPLGSHWGHGFPIFLRSYYGLNLAYPSVLFEGHFYSILIWLIFLTNAKILMLHITLMTQHRIHVQQTYLVYY